MAVILHEAGLDLEIRKLPGPVRGVVRKLITIAGRLDPVTRAGEPPERNGDTMVLLGSAPGGS